MIILDDRWVQVHLPSKVKWKLDPSCNCDQRISMLLPLVSWSWAVAIVVSNWLVMPFLPQDHTNGCRTSDLCTNGSWDRQWRNWCYSLYNSRSRQRQSGATVKAIQATAGNHIQVVECTILDTRVHYAMESLRWGSAWSISCIHVSWTVSLWRISGKVPGR